MIRPNLNINGSSPSDLTGPRLRAIDHLREAIQALGQTTPNGRDYPGDSTQCDRDRDEHYHRVAALRDLCSDLMEEAVYIRGQE